MITKAVLTSEDQAELPCIAIPDSLAIAPPIATQQLLEVLSKMGLDSVRDLSPEVTVALFLAFEKMKGVTLFVFRYGCLCAITTLAA